MFFTKLYLFCFQIQPDICPDQYTMEFNKLIRNPKREVNTEAMLNEILDEGFLCHVAFSFEGNAMMIPIAYGHDSDFIYLHGAASNFMLNQACNGQTVCISVTHLDGIVMAKNLFHSSANYRTAILFGKAECVDDPVEKEKGLRLISEQVMKGRTAEVRLGTDDEIRTTRVIRFRIERASVKVRTGGPMGDEDEKTEVWSGVIPLVTMAMPPIFDPKRTDKVPYSSSVQQCLQKYHPHAH